MNRKWMKHGLCADNVRPMAFFFNFRTRDEAKEFCAPCPVRKQCLEFAVTEVDPGHSDKVVSTLGVWGGVDGTERVRMRAQLNKQKAGKHGG